MSRKSCKLEQNFKIFLNRNLNIFCLVYLLIFSLVLVLSSICYCSKIIFFSEYFQISESDFVHFRSLFLQVQSKNVEIFWVFHTRFSVSACEGSFQVIFDHEKVRNSVYHELLIGLQNQLLDIGSN